MIITILFGILGSVNATSQATIKLISNQSTIKNDDVIKVIVGYDKSTEISEGINVYKAKLEYDEQIFEEVSQNNFKTLNHWSEFKYNKNTKEFITVKKDISKNSEDIIEITLKTKKETNLKDTNIKIKEIVTSGGEKDIAINEINLKINFDQNEHLPEKEESNTSTNKVTDERVPEQEKENNTSSNNVNNEKVPENKENNAANNINNEIISEKTENNNSNKETKKENENLFSGILPNAGDSNTKSIIIFLIILVSKQDP